MRRRRTVLLLLFICLATALTGQYCFARVRERFWDGVFFYAVAVLCWIGLLTIQAEKGPSSSGAVGSAFPQRVGRAAREAVRRLGEALQAHPVRAGIWLVLLVAIGTTLRLNAARLNGPAAFLWLAGIVASIAVWGRLRQEPLEEGGTLVEEEPPPEVRVTGSWGGWLLAHRETLAVAGLTLAALLLRLVELGTIPYVLSGDEASMGLEAVNILEGRLNDPFATGWLGHPTLYFFLLAGPVGLLGRNAWGLRFLSPWAGAATIPALYLLARRLFGRRVAWVAAVLLTVSHLHIHFSRLAINNIYDPLFGLLAFYFLVRGLRGGRLRDFAWSGFFLAFEQYFYMGGRLFPIMMAVYLLLWWVLPPAGRRIQMGSDQDSGGTAPPKDRRTFRRLSLPFLALGGSFIATAAPLLRFFLLHPDDFWARLRIVGIIQSGWLRTEPGVTGKSVVELLWDQLRKSFLAFNYTVDPTSWYNAQIPYLDFLSATFFLLGLVVLLRNWRRPGYLLVNVWFWLCLIFGGMLIENPPSSPRFVIFLPAVCLIVALGLLQLLDIAAGVVGLSPAWKRRLLALLLLAAVTLNLGFYFFLYTPSRVFGGLNTEVGTRVGEYLRRQEVGTEVYFFGPPRMWVGYASILFLAPGMVTHDVEQPLTGPPAFPFTGDALFIFLPERAGELAWVAQSYPGGTRQDVPGHTGEVLFVVYEVHR